jgi:capsular polysaccharide export protein
MLMGGMAARDSRVLLLQGPPSAFWGELGDGFAAAGAALYKVNLCLGDRVYWGRRPAIAFKGRRSDWPAFIEKLIGERGITDLLYYGDRMPYHAQATEIAHRLGVRSHAVEFGYLRPGWITLERGGMGAWSHFPNDPAIVRAAAAAVSAVDEARRYSHAFGVEAFNEVVFNLLTSFDWLVYPHYDPDRFYVPLVEYLSSFLRTARRHRQRPTVAQVTDEAASGAWPYALYALQLQSDWQIRANSPYRDQREALDSVIGSMSRHASPSMRLIVKLHPMDTGMIDWARETAAIARRHGVSDRILFIDGGDLDRLMAEAAVVLVINSTVGLHALRAGRPTKALGIAVYDMPGLTEQRDLDAIWAAPSAPDPELTQALVRLLAATIQVRGSFYAEDGRKPAIDEIVRRVLEGDVNQPGAFVVPPPRLKNARTRGVLV